MCSRADVDGSIVRRNMGRPRRSTIASTAGVRREFGRASSRRRPNLLNRRNEWLSTARMSKRIGALAAEKGASEQAIGITKGGRNSKIHGLVDKLCRPWVLILTPGNTADCTVGPACVSLLDGIAELLGDKAYDSNSFRKSLRKDGAQAGQIGRNAYITTSKPIRIATSSSAATAGSRT
jgi:Transposase DDE domain